MKRFIDFEVHSPEKPNKDFINVCCGNTQDEGLKKEIEALNKELTYQTHEKPLIFIGMGTCGLASGAGKVKDAIVEELERLNIEAEIVPTGCIGYCAVEPIVDVKLPGEDRIVYSEVTPKDVPALVKQALVEKDVYAKKLLGKHGITNEKATALNENPFFSKQEKRVLENCGIINPDSIDEYIAAGGFKGLSKALNQLSAREVIDEVIESGLRGRGGGGFPTGKKWEFAFNQDVNQKYMVCNADEGDPGAFMDRAILESDPFKLIEGMIIGGFAIGANFGYIYCRAEYPLAIERLNKAIDECKTYGLLGENILGSGVTFNLKIKKGAGAFVCGEETALIASIEGKRGMPKPRPPFPAVSGLFDKPTIINNVETFANVANIIAKGAKWFNSIGTEKSKGTKVFALSGKLTNSGLVEVPMGTTLEEVVFDIGGGIPDGKKFKAVQIGGPSGGCLPESVIKTEVDYDSLIQVGAMMGSGGFVVMDENTCMVDVAKFFMTFITSESCGKCVPCREGTKRMLEIIERIPQSYDSAGNELDALQRFKGIVNLKKLAEVIQDTSLCGLGKSAPNPILSGLKYFKEEYEEHLFERKCSAGVCKELLTYTIDPEKCTGCTLCAIKCPNDSIVGEKKYLHEIIQQTCIQCGMCYEACNFGAVKIS